VKDFKNGLTVDEAVAKSSTPRFWHTVLYSAPMLQMIGLQLI